MRHRKTERKIDKQINQADRWLIDRVPSHTQRGPTGAREGDGCDGEGNEWKGQDLSGQRSPGQTHPTDDVVMVREVSLASLASVDLVAVEIGVVREPHGCDNDGRRLLTCSATADLL